MPACSDRLDSVTRVAGSCVDASCVAPEGGVAGADVTAGDDVDDVIDEMVMMHLKILP
jgi:hypothetical protein